MRKSGARVVNVNPAFESLTGYKEEEVLGQNLRMLQGANTEQDVLVDIIQSLREGARFQAVLTNYRKDGTSFHNCMSLKPVHSSTGRYHYCVGLLADADIVHNFDEIDQVLSLIPDIFEVLGTYTEY